MAGLLLTGAALTACTSDDILSEPAERAISFDTFINGDQSRALPMTTNNIDKVGVFAFFTGETTWADYQAKDTPNYMVNQLVSRTITNGAATPWSYDPQRYWPASETEKMSFFAYAPYDANMQWNNGVISYSLVNQVDLLYSCNHLSSDRKPTTDLTRNSYATGTVPFQMAHALARIDFEVATTAEIANDPGVTIKVTRVCLEGKGTQQLYFSGKFNVFTGQWSDYGFNDNIHYSPYKEFDADVADRLTAEYRTLILPQYTFMEIPADFTTDLLRVGIDYTISVDDPELGTVETPTSATKNISINFKQGYAYKLRILVSPTAIEVGATEEEWVVNGEVDIVM